MTVMVNKRFANGKWYRYAPRIKAAIAPTIKQKRAASALAAIALSSLMVSAYYEHTKPETHGMKATESTAYYYGDTYKVPMKASKPIADRIQMRRSEQERRKASHLPKPSLTRLEGKLLEESGIEYWKANPKAKNQKIKIVL